MNFERMRVLLLERAIRGELVPQLTEDGSIEQVGDRKGLFDIPKSWGWFEFSNVVKTISSRGYQIPAKEISEKGRFPVVTQSKNILIDGYSEEESKLVPKAFLPLLVFGDHTRFLKYVDFQFIVGADGTKLIRPKDDNLVNCSYLYYVLRALVPETKDRGYSRHFQFLKKLMIPVPPIHEQCRIVDRVEELLSEIDRADKAYEELQTLAGVLRGQILQEAIQGKLVPQLAEEGVVEQIGDAPDEVPFVIPESWKWKTLKNITGTITDGTHHSPKNSQVKDEVFKNLYVTAKNIKYTGVDLSKPTYVDDEVHAEIIQRCSPAFGDVLFVKDGATTGVVTVNDLQDSFSMLSSVALIKTLPEVLDSQYLVYVLRSPVIEKLIRSKMKGTGIPRVTLKILQDIPIPVPPFDEQLRIVGKVCDLLKQVKALSV